MNSTNSFIKKAKKVHKNRYIYDNTTFIKSSYKITIICRIHGVFQQRADHHLLGHHCKLCSNISKGRKKRNYSKKTFIKRAILKHCNKYKYTKTVYKNAISKLIVTCPIHGDFNISPNNHLAGRGCPKCGFEYTASLKRSSITKFIRNATQLHNNKYSYLLSDYVNSGTRLKIICPIHGIFEQTPNIHLKGSECPKCYIPSWTKAAWIKRSIKINNTPQLYIIECYNNIESFIKIGITQQKISNRFSSTDKMPYKYKILHTIKANPDKIWELEKILHKKYKLFKYSPLILFPGKTECFDISIKEIVLSYLYSLKY